MYERVVVPYDGSERSLAALPPARRVAQAWKCDVEVVHVWDGSQPKPSAAPVDQAVRFVTADDPATALTGLAAEPSTLLCMATRGRGAAAELLLGSVTRAVLHDIHEPLVITGPQALAPAAADGLRRLMVCLDGSTVSAAILRVARRWAEALGLEVLVVHVAYPLAEHRPVDYPEETRVVVAELRRTAAELTEAGIVADWAVVEDTDPATGIIRQAAHRMVDLIAMATHGRTGLERVLMGSVTTSVVRGASVPVLTLRPRQLGR